MRDKKSDDEKRPIIINITERNEIRKERIVAVGLVVLIAALAILIYKSLH